MDEQRAWIKSRRKKWLRIAAAILCFCLLVTTYPNIIETVSAFAKGLWGEDGSVSISGFAELPKEISEQTVPVGTPVEELTLPDTLEAYVTVVTDDSAGIEGNPNENPDDSEQNNGDKENPDNGNGDGGEENPEDGIKDGESEGGDTKETETEDENTSGEKIQQEGSADEQKTDSDNGDGVTEESNTVSIPEYYAENEIIVETLENTQVSGTQEETVTIAGITWQSEPEYDKDTAGIYIFTPILPEGYAPAEGVSLPEIIVTVQESEAEAVIQALLERITALPELEEYLATEPDMEEDEEAYTQWEEKLYEYAEEALGIWEEYEVLTEEQQAQIPEEELTRLAAWVELAEQLSQSRMVMAAAVMATPGVISSNQEWGAQTLAAGTYTINPGVTVTVTGKLTVNGDVTIEGGGKLVRGDASAYFNVSGGNLTLQNIEVDGASESSSYAMIAATSNGKVTLGNGCWIHHCTKSIGGQSDGGGAVLHLNSSSAILGEAVIENCQCISYGGAVYMTGGSSLIINGGTYRENSTTSTSSYGGGFIYNVGAKVKIYGGRFIDNTSKGRGGCIYNAGREGTETYLYGGYFQGNKSTYTSSTGKGSGAVFYSSENTANTVISLSGNVQFCGDGVDGSGTDGVFLGVASNAVRKAQISSELKYPLALYLAAEEGRVIAEGVDGYQLQKKDMKKISFTDVGSSGTVWYAKLDEANNQIILTKTDPGYQLYVTYDVNGGAGAVSDDREYESGDIVTVKSGDGFQREGYHVGGWNTKPDGTGTTYQAGDTFQITDDVTLYAQWTANSYTITYNKNGGTITNESNYYSYTYGAGLTLPKPTRKGYAFDGWYTNSGFTGTTVTKISTTDTGNKSYYAKWTANAYTVTYNTNGGAIANESNYTSYTCGTGLNLPKPTRNGYTFGGWYESSDFSETAVEKISTSDTGNKKYYAKWTSNKYTVTFDYQDATGGNTTTNKEVTYDSEYGELPAPEKSNYVFKGWYTQKPEQGKPKGDLVTAEIKVTIANTHTLYAYWKDETAPDKPVLKEGVTLPEDWKKEQTIPLTLRDNVAVTELWVKIDDGTYQKVAGFTNADGSTVVNYEFTETVTGDHTYHFKAKDAAGNSSEESRGFRVMIDNSKPVIGEFTYENKAKDFLDWIIGKKSMIIKVPVTDEGSGVEQIRYTMMSADGATVSDKSGTAEVKNGKAEVTFAQDFKGTITITCTDAVGNAADSVTIGVSGGGVIVEDTSPEITVLADRGTSDTSSTHENGVALSEGYYETVPAIIVTVQDDIGGAITAGIEAITYQVNDGTKKKVSVERNVLQEQVTFTIPTAEIPTGVTEIRITATDNAGNEASKSITVKSKGPEKTPAAAINYDTEKLKGLVPNDKYLINGTSYSTDREGCISIDESWFGTTVSIVKTGNGNETSDSSAQSLSIPQRPQQPVPVGVDVSTPGGTGKLTGLSANTVYEISTDGGKTWKTKTETANGSGEIIGLAPGSYTVRVKVGASNFVSEKSNPVKIGTYQIKVTFKVNGEKYKEISVDYGTALTEIPSVPKKKDAGEQIFVGEWCRDEQGTTPAVFTNVISDMTVYAVYSTGYTVTLQGGTGCILSAVSGSVSPVREGGSFTFKFTLDNGYEKTGSFAVKVNGVKVELAAGDTYTITDIIENKSVTVEGIQKKTSSGGAGSPGQNSDKDQGDNSTNDDNQPVGGDNPTTDKNLTTGDTLLTDGNLTSDSLPSTGDNHPSDVSSPTGDTPPIGGKASMDGNHPTDGTTPTDNDSLTDGTPTAEGSPSTDGNVLTDGNPTTGSNPPGGEEIQVVPVVIEDGNIIISGETEAIAEYGPVMTDSVNGMTIVSTILQIGNGNNNGGDTGAVIVTVVCEDEKYAAGVTDTVAVVNAVLTPAQIQLVGGGETIEVRIDVKDISKTVTVQDKAVIENGLGVYREELPGLTLGMYVDISMFIRAGEGDWDVVTSTDEPIEVVIGIPEELKEDGREFYIIRAHEGEYTLLNDMDNDPNTITISTDRFSSYAIAYKKIGVAYGNHMCGLCHICPMFLDICYFIWLAIIGAEILVFVAVIVILRRKREKEEV